MGSLPVIAVLQISLKNVDALFVQFSDARHGETDLLPTFHMARCAFDHLTSFMDIERTKPCFDIFVRVRRLLCCDILVGPQRLEYCKIPVNVVVV